MKEEMCLVDSCTTNTILREVRYFQTLTKREGMVLTIAGRDAMIVGSCYHHKLTGLIYGPKARWS